MAKTAATACPLPYPARFEAAQKFQQSPAAGLGFPQVIICGSPLCPLVQCSITELDALCLSPSWRVLQLYWSSHPAQHISAKPQAQMQVLGSTRTRPSFCCMPCISRPSKAHASEVLGAHNCLIVYVTSCSMQSMVQHIDSGMFHIARSCQSPAHHGCWQWLDEVPRATCSQLLVVLPKSSINHLHRQQLHAHQSMLMDIPVDDPALPNLLAVSRVRLPSDAVDHVSTC